MSKKVQQNKPMQEVGPKNDSKDKEVIGVKISHDDWSKIMGELSVFKQPVIDAVVKAVNSNSSPLFN